MTWRFKLSRLNRAMEEHNTHEVFFTAMDKAVYAAYAMVTLQYDMDDWIKENTRYVITRWAHDTVEGKITYDFDQQIHNPNYSHQADPPLAWQLIIEKLNPTDADYGGRSYGMKQS